MSLAFHSHITFQNWQKNDWPTQKVINPPKIYSKAPKALTRFFKLFVLHVKIGPKNEQSTAKG